jgi:signal transduction histidine kinase
MSLPVPTRLNSRSLLASRILYGLLLLLCAGLFAISLYTRFIRGIGPCDIYYPEWGEGCFNWHAAMEGLGLTAVAFEGYFVVLRIVAAAPFVFLSLLLMRQRGQELRVMLLASLLVVLAGAGPWFNPHWGWGGYWFETFTSLPFLGRTAQLLTFLLYSGLFLFAFLFPSGRFVPRWSRWATALFVPLAAGYAFFPEGSASWANMPFPLGTLIPVTFMFLAIAAVVWRYRRQASTVERQQIKWVTFGFLVMALNLMLDVAVFNIYPAISGEYPLATGRQAVLWDLGQDSLWYVSQILFAACIGLAVFRHRLWDIDLILSRTLVYGTLSVLVAALYILVVGGLGALFQTRTNTISGLVAAGIVAILFQPVRERLQRGVNRLLYGERDDPAAILARLAHHLETADAPDAILPNLVQTIAHTLKIPYTAIRVPAGAEQTEAVATWGEAPADVEAIPLTYQDEVIGHLVVAPRGPGESFQRRERQLLNTIAALTASTVRAVLLSDELRRSRQRIVTAREEERRRLRRDLHDGLGPQLASQTLGMGAVEQLLPTDPEKARALLASLKKQAQEAIVDVRRLVYGLRPPALDDLGLVGALEQSVARYEGNGIRFTFDVPAPLPALPAAVETAVFRIAQEALTNVVRHAQATACTIRLVCEGDALRLVIADNGQGLSITSSSGVGLHSMRERAAELNGQCVLESNPQGGTKVNARLPLEACDG